MKKILKTLLVLSVLSLIVALSACMPVAKYYVCPDGHQVLDPKNCEQLPTAEPAENEEPTGSSEAEPLEEEPADVVIKEITPEAQELIDKSNKASTVKFSYMASTNPYPDNLYYASRDKMKIELQNKLYFSSTDAYDTVYYDFSSSTVSAYCERQSIDTCNDKNKKVVDIAYEEYLIKTPFDWLQDLEKAELTGRSKMINAMKAIELSFQKEGKQGLMFLDSFYGIPITVSYEGVTYDYLGLGINTGSTDDLVHQEIN